MAVRNTESDSEREQMMSWIHPQLNLAHWFSLHHLCGKIIDKYFFFFFLNISNILTKIFILLNSENITITCYWYFNSPPSKSSIYRFLKLLGRQRSFWLGKAGNVSRLWHIFTLKLEIILIICLRKLIMLFNSKQKETTLNHCHFLQYLHVSWFVYSFS